MSRKGGAREVGGHTQRVQNINAMSVLSFRKALVLSGLFLSSYAQFGLDLVNE